MFGRAWWVGAVLTAGLAQAGTPREYAFGGPEPQKVVASPPPRFAAGASTGPWAWMELGTIASPPNNYEMTLAQWTQLTAGWGFDAGPVHLRPAASFQLAYNLGLLDTPSSSRFEPGPVALSLAASNLLDDERHTGLRLTPALGLTIPTQVGAEIPWSTFSMALQLERRFGPVELAWRAQAGKPFFPAPAPCLQPIFCSVSRNPINWFLVNSLQGEGWITPSLSVGLRLGLEVAWNQLLPGGLGIPAQTVADTRLSTSGHAWISWAFVRLFGLSADLFNVQSFRRADGTVRVPFFSFERPDQLRVSLSLWFRTDFALARNWLER